MIDVIPHGEIHEVQITEKNLYAVDELLGDAIYEHQHVIADLRKKLTMPCEYPDQTHLLVSIQVREGKIEIIKDILSQLGISPELQPRLSDNDEAEATTTRRRSTGANSR